MLCGEVVSITILENDISFNNQTDMTLSLIIFLQDEDGEEHLEGFTRVPIEVILASQARDAEEKSNRDKFKLQALKERGMLMHGDGLADDI